MLASVLHAASTTLLKSPLYSGGENALALRAWRGDHGDTRALLGLAVGGVPHNAEPAIFKKRFEKGLFEPGDPADYCC